MNHYFNNNATKDTTYLSRKTNRGIRIQKAMQQMLLQTFNSKKPFNLHITLNSFADYSIHTLMAKTRYWEKDLLCRLFRNQANTETTKEQFTYYGFLEFTKKEEPHYHLLVYITPEKLAWLIRTAPKLWQKQVPSGQCYIQQLNHLPHTEKYILIHYVTKELAKPFAYEHYVCFGKR